MEQGGRNLGFPSWGPKGIIFGGRKKAWTWGSRKRVFRGKIPVIHPEGPFGDGNGGNKPGIYKPLGPLGGRQACPKPVGKFFKGYTLGEFGFIPGIGHPLKFRERKAPFGARGVKQVVGAKKKGGPTLWFGGIH